METETLTQNEKGYIKLYKNSRGYNWEIKNYEEKDPKALKDLIKDLEEINLIMIEKFGGQND